MLALTTIETSVLDIAHLVGVAAAQHFVDETLIVGRVVARTELFKPIPVIDKDLFEDVPVPRRFNNHQIAPREDVGLLGIERFTTFDALDLPPSSVFTGVRSPPPRPGITGTSGKPENEKPYAIKI